MIIRQKTSELIISALLGLSPLIMIYFMTAFIYPDRALYSTPAEVLRVILLAPTVAALPYIGWRLYLRVRSLDPHMT